MELERLKVEHRVLQDEYLKLYIKWADADSSLSGAKALLELGYPGLISSMQSLRDRFDTLRSEHKTALILNDKLSRELAKLT